MVGLLEPMLGFFGYQNNKIESIFGNPGIHWVNISLIVWLTRNLLLPPESRFHLSIVLLMLSYVHVLSDYRA